MFLNTIDHAILLRYVIIQGEYMISSSFDIREFINAVEDKEYFDIIYLTDREATEVERRLYHPKTSLKAKKDGSQKYANQLKNFLSFLRYDVRPHTSSVEIDYQLFQSVLKKLEKRKPKYTHH